MPLSNEEVYAIGIDQKAMLWLIPLSLIAHFLFPPALIFSGLIGAKFIFDIAKSTKSRFPWLWALFFLIPGVSLICLVALNSRATGILRSKGIKVGIMGANQNELDSILAHSKEK